MFQEGQLQGDGLGQTLRADLLPGQSKCQKGGQIRMLPSLTTPIGCSKGGDLKGLRTSSNVHGHVPDT